MENKILIGADAANPLYDLRDSEIRLGISGVVTSSLVGDELAVDQLRFRVNAKNVFRSVYNTTAGKVLADRTEAVYVLNETPENALNALETLPYATPVRYYQNGELTGKFYLDSVEQVTRTDFYLNCVSALGILDKQKHLGGIYTGQLLPAVLSEIIGGTFPFSTSDALRQIKVYNWLPIESKRDAIHQIVYAFGVNVLKRADGELYFDYLQQTEAAQLPDSRIFLGGSTKHTPPATRVEVIEHSFFKLSTDTDVVLFDNTDGAAPAGNSFVAFREAPVYGLSASSGLVIHESGVNYAVVSGIGVLTGKRYNHQTNRVGRDSPDASGVEKIVDGGSECTLVSVLNSSNVTRRLLSYYSSAQTISASVIVNGEKPGDQLTFNSPFGRATAAFLASMEYGVTSFERARCELVTNYEPTPPGGGDYTHVDVVSASGTWTVPEGVTEFTAVLIGGGTGGSGGYDGEAGKNGSSATASAGSTSTSNGGAGGKGGAAGPAGSGGRVFQVRLEASAGTAFTVSVGAGGKGGARNGGSGSAGGNTTFSGGGSSYTSANGAVSSAGYFDVMSQSVYASAGEAGSSGGAGGVGNRGDNAEQGGNGEYIQGHTGGTGSARAYYNQQKTVYEKPAKFDSSFTTYTRYNQPRSSSQVWNQAYIEEIEDSGGGSISGPFYDPGAATQRDTYAEYYYGFYEVNSETGAWVTGLSTGKIYEPSSTFGVRMISQIVSNGKVLRLCLYGVNNTGQNQTYIQAVEYSALSRRAGHFYYKAGSGGGGASINQNGSNATTNAGGSGASGGAVKVPSVPGTGGAGGNGGGGGGGGGGVQLMTQSYAPSTTISGGAGGSGGLGSAGGDGAPGCVLIYY